MGKQSWLRMVSALLLAGCAASPPAPAPPPVAAGWQFATPATFTGDLPCADCTGIRTTLTLRADGLFLMRRVYLDGAGVDTSYRELGRWTLLDEGRTLELAGGAEGPQRFALRDADTLRQLDRAGREIDSALNYELRRAPGLDPISEPLRLRGLYTYMADAASLAECATGQRFPVAMVGDSVSLERAYLAARSAPGAPLLVTLDGRIEERPSMEEGRRELAVVVERFQRAWPGESCASRVLAVPLIGTHWVITQLRGAVLPATGGEQPWLELRPELGRAQGFTGCNRFNGRYTLDGPKLSLTDLATTEMFCVGRMDIEKAFIEALKQTTGYRMDGADLALTVGGGTLAWLREAAPPAGPR